MKPTKSILDPDFKYVPSHATDVRETFERAKREALRDGHAIVKHTHDESGVTVTVVPLREFFK